MVAFLLPVLVVSSFYSCNDEFVKEETSPLSSSSNGEVMDERIPALFSKSHKLSLEKARQYAKVAGEYVGVEKNGLKKCRSKKIVDVAVITSHANRLKSTGTYGTSDTTAYVFNYADNQGFSVIGADYRIGNPIIAYVDEGCYNAESLDELQQMLMDEINSYVKRSISSFEYSKDSLFAVANASRTNALKSLDLEVPIIYDPSNDYKYTTVGPLLKTRWGQKEEYNDFIQKQNRNKDYCVGCVGIAVGQTLAYLRLNKMRYQGITYLWDWDAMTSSPDIKNLDSWGKQSVQRFLWIVAEELDTDYGKNSSTSSIRKADRLLDDFYNTDRRNYNVDKVKNSINNKKPVIMRGAPKGSSSGHCWVVDGYQKVTYKNTSVTEYLHHNWGWYGYNNGWFKIGVFDPDQFEFGSLDVSKGYYSDCKDYSYSKEMILIK